MPPVEDADFFIAPLYPLLEVQLVISNSSQSIVLEPRHLPFRLLHVLRLQGLWIIWHMSNVAADSVPVLQLTHRAVRSLAFAPRIVRKMLLLVPLCWRGTLLTASLDQCSQSSSVAILV